MFNRLKWCFYLIGCLGFLFTACKKDLQNNPSGLNEPIIKSGDFFPNSNWNDPHVIEIDGKLVMYASASQNFDQNVKIYRMESQDGITWKQHPSDAVFSRSDNLNDWDSKSVETPAVVYYNGKYHLFYTGYKTVYSDAGNFKVGHLVSTNGINWNKDYSFLLKPTAPNSIPNFNFNQYVVGEPAPVVFNNKLYLYFTAIGVDDSLHTSIQTIGLTIYDGSSWSSPVLALKPIQNLYPRDKFVGYSTPNAIVKDGKVHLYFDVIQDNPWKQIKIHHAESANGITDWITDISPLINKEDYAWAEDEIRAPSAIYFNNKLYLYFAGSKGVDLGIGLKIIE